MLFICIILNLIGLLMMYFDKQFAINDMWRIPEKMLLSFAIFSAGIGVLFGMFLFKHKTRKVKFLVLIPFACILNVCMYMLLLIK